MRATRLLFKCVSTELVLLCLDLRYGECYSFFIVTEGRFVSAVVPPFAK